MLFFKQAVAVLLSMPALAWTQGNGPDCSFSLDQTLNVGQGLNSSVAINDLNGDTFPDIAVADGASNEITILFNDGKGGFLNSVKRVVDSFPTAVLAGDLDGDSDTDLVISMFGNVAVLSNGGAGDFSPPINYPTGDGIVLGMSLGDLDGDSDLDVAATQFLQPANGISVLLNSGDGSFGDHVLYSVSTFSFFDFALGDLDGDADLDFAVVDLDNSGLSAFFNNGDGTFAAQVSYDVGGALYSPGVSDFNGDMHQDVVALNAGGVCVMLNDGKGTFSDEVNYPVESGDDLEIQDVNRDGDMDIAVSGFRTFSILLGAGDGTFADELPFKVDVEAQITGNSLAHGDLDGDLDIDFAGLNSSEGTVAILANECGQSTILGDVNLDGFVNLLDVAPFIQLISEGVFQAEGDINEDGSVDLLDVGPFVQLLGGS